MDHEEPPLGPFATLYEEFAGASEDRAPAIESQLIATYRDAWRTDDWQDQVYVLYFAYKRRDPGDADLFLDGMGSANWQVAEAAALRAWVLRDKHGFDFGPDLRKAFRAYVRRHPVGDLARPPDMYGHLPGDEDDRAERPFINLFEDWMAVPHPRDPAIQQQLTHTYRDAWAAGDGVDRAFVLHFINLARSPHHDSLPPVDGRDLVVDALKSDDPVLARSAGFVAWSHLHDGVDLGPDIRSILEAHLRRFPQRTGHALTALQELDERDASGTDN